MLSKQTKVLLLLAFFFTLLLLPLFLLFTLDLRELENSYIRALDREPTDQSASNQSNHFFKGTLSHLSYSQNLIFAAPALF
jgi:thiol:disulfide interchange protein